MEQRVLRSPRAGRGAGGSGRLSVVSVEREYSACNAVVGNRLWLEVCAAERGVGRLSVCLPARRLPDFGMLPVPGASLFLCTSQGPAGTRLASPLVTGGCGTAGEQRGAFPCALPN